MKVYYSDAHIRHNPPFEIFDGGEKLPNFEMPERAERVLLALKETGWAEILSPANFGLEPILAVHDADYVDFLRTGFNEWLTEETDYERIALLPATFPPGNMRRRPKSLLGRAGYYMMDLSAPIVAGTYPAALQSAYCALSGAYALTEGNRSAFALCRPPGHHAGKANCGGYCYLNNAAIAANFLLKHGKVTILDIDYHAGNGTQDIFYDRADVLSISIHSDPDYEYPYFAGYADETGAGEGLGFHRNFPLPKGTDDTNYLITLNNAVNLIRNFAPSFLVISAGMDIFGEDRLGKFNVTRDGIHEIGQRIAQLNTPILVVMEGGYNNAALGENFITFLSNIK